MRVLVTNDDGIGAPGLAVLAAGLRDDGHDVLVVAPAQESSGSAAGVGPVTAAPVAVGRHHLPEASGIPAYAVGSPPAFAVLAACSGMFGDPPEVVVSGVNPGWNTGAGVVHSGTVGAALTGARLGCSALAVSCGPLPGARFDTATAVAVALLAAGVLEAGVALNVNVPDAGLDRLRGAVEVPLAARSVYGVRLERREGSIVATERLPGAHSGATEPGTDGAALLAGYVAITRLLPGVRTLPADPAATAAGALAGLLQPGAVAG